MQNLEQLLERRKASSSFATRRVPGKTCSWAKLASCILARSAAVSFGEIVRRFTEEVTETVKAASDQSQTHLTGIII